VQRLSARRLIFLPIFLAALVLAVAACGSDDEGDTAAPADTGAAATGATETTKEPAELRVALDWFANPDHISLFYAQDNGYFDDEALDVTMKTPSDPSAGLKLVATNKFDLAVFYEGDIFFAAEQDLPVMAVGSLIPTPLNSVMSTADSKVQSPEDFKGATIGVAGLPFDDAILETIRQQQGLSEDDIKKVNVGFNLVPALLTGKADAVIGAYWNIEATHVESEDGKPATVIRLEELGVPTYDELIIVANRDKLQSDEAYADAVRRFLAAMIKGSEAAQQDEAGSIEIMKEDTDYKDAEIEDMVPATLGALKSPTGTATGCFDLEGWAEFGQWMLDNKLLKAEVDPSVIATNEYLPDGCE
jgi:putative hydroxymethylpyrimidine transport system substrate-binding protein